MKTLGFVLFFIFLVESAVAQSPLRIEKTDGQVKLQWEAIVPPVIGAQADFQLEASHDFSLWETAAPPITVSDNQPLVQILPPGETAYRFFRLRKNTAFGAASGDPGPGIYGFSSAYAKHLHDVAQISLEDFAASFPTENGLLQIDWDPTTARFWTEFNTDPADHNRALPLGDPEQRKFDFRLNAQELALFKKNGFVVTERLGALSFGELLYRLYNDDLPLYLSSDVILQAWHRSYASMLRELEETWMFPAWIELLESLSAHLAALWETHRETGLKQSLLDCDYFLTVARSLAAGSNAPSRLGQDELVQHTLEAIRTEQAKSLEVFGEERLIDFSQFKPRGYYAETPVLQRYFQTIMWLSRIDFRVTAAASVDPSEALRELRDSALLFLLLKQANALENWSQLNAVIELFVGLPDSMNFAQIARLLQSAGISTIGDLAASASLERVQQLLLEGNFGVQQIMGDLYVAPAGKLPRSFTVFGQRFVPDSWALGKVVYDNIRWANTNVLRRLPGAADVAFGALANNAVVPFIVAGIKGELEPGHEWRDGVPYQHNLTAVRMTLDELPPEFWSQNIYVRWLDALRTLSESHIDPRLPQSMRTHAWAMKSLNTQLASWTELRHDTVLYAKQSYTSMIICSYPCVFVEAVPVFWQKMADMAAFAANGISRVTIPQRQIPFNGYELSSSEIRSNQVAFLRQFSDRMTTLRQISTKELERKPLSDEETEFLHNVVEIQKLYDGLQYSGWLPALFYRSAFYKNFPNWRFHQDQGISRRDSLVTDVHTVPNDIDAGHILHQAIGRVNFLFMAVETVHEKIVCGGPVFTHYEMPTEGMNRMTDDEWDKILNTAGSPAPPLWTQEFLIRN
jgi:hypothetical protein